MTEALQKNSGFSIPEIFDPYFLECLHEHWTQNHLSFGADLIDAQHLWITALIYRMEGLLLMPVGQPRLIKLTGYARELFGFLQKHFAFEELIMKAADFPGTAARLAEHADFLARLRDTFLTKTDLVADKVAPFVKFMRAWFMQHLKGENAEWKALLLKKHLNVNDFARAVLKDPEAEDEAAHTLLYRQLIIDHEYIAGIKREILNDIFLLWRRFDIRTQTPLIDMQHLWLIKMVVEIEGMLHVNFDERRILLERTLGELIAYVNMHFKSEEGLMQKLGYAEEKAHHAMHEDFKRTVSKLKFDYDSGNHHSMSNLVTVMRQWLITHIVIEDAKFARYCQQDAQKSLEASRLLIREKAIALSRDQTLLFMYIAARLRAT